MFEGNTISVNADSCCVTTAARIDTQIVVFTCDAPEAAAKAIEAERAAPVISNVFEALEHPAIMAFVDAIRAPIRDAVRSPGATSFEELCAGRTIRVDSRN
jgi:ABC-type sugar transport system substrate-binding protein